MRDATATAAGGLTLLLTLKGILRAGGTKLVLLAVSCGLPHQPDHTASAFKIPGHFRALIHQLFLPALTVSPV